MIDWMNPSEDVVEARRIGYEEGIARWNEENEALEAENARLRAVVERLSKADYYWDAAGYLHVAESDIREAVSVDDVGDIVELRQVHELPRIWVLVTEDTPQVFSTLEAAKAAKEGE